MKTTKAEREQARQNLLEWLKPGDTVYTILRHVARSGMSRRISLVVIRPDKTRRSGVSTGHLDWNAARFMSWRCKDNGEGIQVGGCGMDMGFHLVSTLSRALFADDPRAPKYGDHDNFASEITKRAPDYWLHHEWL